ncbi:MAG: CvpA family protein [Clostridia bacterium]|nr:CvpA family protein [Clostridia bacterium]MBR6701951.1 CvpA family protein [Clostridia bacterium]
MPYLPYIITAVPFVILAVAVIVGRVKGFAGIILSAAAIIACMILARAYAAPLAEAVTAKIIHPKLISSVSKQLIEGLANGKATVAQILPGMFTAAAESGGISAESAVTADAVKSISETISLSAEKIAIVPLLTAVFFALVYIIAKLISRIFIKLSDLILKLPFIRQANNWLGAVFGGITGLILAALSVLLIVSVSRMIPDSAFSVAVGKASLINLFYEKLQLII